MRDSLASPRGEKEPKDGAKVRHSHSQSTARAQSTDCAQIPIPMAYSSCSLSQGPLDKLRTAVDQIRPGANKAAAAVAQAAAAAAGTPRDGDEPTVVDFGPEVRSAAISRKLPRSPSISLLLWQVLREYLRFNRGGDGNVTVEQFVAVIEMTLLKRGLKAREMLSPPHAMTLRRNPSRVVRRRSAASLRACSPRRTLTPMASSICISSCNSTR